MLLSLTLFRLAAPKCTTLWYPTTCIQYIICVTSFMINCYTLLLTVFSFLKFLISGSHDGFIRLWQCANNFRTLKEVNSIPVVGFVNALAIAPDGTHIVAAVGQEHRLGRWWREKEARNSTVVFPLKPQKFDIVWELLLNSFRCPQHSFVLMFSKLIKISWSCWCLILFWLLY